MAELALDDAERMLDLGPKLPVVAPPVRATAGDAMMWLICTSSGCSGLPFGAFRMTPQTLPGPLNAASRPALT